MDVARVVVGRLIHREPLDPSCNDHPLGGEWVGHRECPLEAGLAADLRGWDDDITVERTGTHADLFDE